MNAARWPRQDTLANQLVALRSSTGQLDAGHVSDLSRHLQPGDLLVVNDAATLPALLVGSTRSGQAVEARLIGELGGGRWRAAILGSGDWRSKTEDRPDAAAGRNEELRFGARLRARIVNVLGSRLVDLEFTAPDDPIEFWDELYRVGRPIQYSYVRQELPLWAVQTAYSSRPWAVEMPSAGHAFRWELLLALKRKGVGIASLTHAAGISSTGDSGLDRRLPLGERYSIPQSTVDAVARARRVIAVGTSVVRALEGCRLRQGQLVAGEGQTGLRLGRHFNPRIVDGVLTGVHELGESHFRLLESFAPRAHLLRAIELAEMLGFLTHEFGDSCLILP